MTLVSQSGEWVPLVERLSAGLWAGGWIALLLVGPVLRKRLPSPRLADECCDEIGHRFGFVRYLLSAGLVVGLFLRAEGGGAGGWDPVRAGIVAVLAAIAIYVGMVLALRLEYYRTKIPNVQTVAADDPWLLRLEAVRRRSSVLGHLGGILATALLLLP